MPVRYRSTTNTIHVDIVSESAAAAVVAKFSNGKASKVYSAEKLFFSPKLRFTDCPFITLHNNTSVKYSKDQEYRSIAKFTCDEGYSLSGAASVQCEENGQWSAEIPKCVGKKLNS